MCDKMAISAHILKIVENDLFLRLQMTAKEMYIRASEHILRADEGCNQVFPRVVSEWHIKEHIKTSSKW